VRRYQVLETVQGEPFDEITRLASEICEAPIALITFVDDERVLIRSKVGISHEETARDVSFCSHAILHKTVFVVPDALLDRRFRDNPLVTKEPRIRFYAGAQLVDSTGHVLGTLCVLDHKPRQLRAFQQQSLRLLARVIQAELEWHRREEAIHRLEIETANLRLVRVIAIRLLHEIGNAMVPISTHQQLLAERYQDPEFRNSFDAALSDGVRRVTRLISQMRHLAQETETEFGSVSLREIVEEAFDSAVKNHGSHSANLHFDDDSGPTFVRGDMAGLTLAFSEIMLNALQANPSHPEVSVRCAVVPDQSSLSEVVVDFLDTGSGFSADTSEKATLPFFSTRSVGSGLGLSVAKKLIGEHHGSLEIRLPEHGELGGVRLRLPRSQPQYGSPAPLAA
jgi:signal transduction histidine kinase